MTGRAARLCLVSKRLWRPLIGVVVAYAVTAHGLVIAFGSFPSAAQVHDGAPGVELCLHDPQDAPVNSPGSENGSLTRLGWTSQVMLLPLKGVGLAPTRT
jgi:hypothetical protein